VTRVALLADIHGNAVALEAVLRDLERQPIDQVVCLGDVAATGPQPQAVLASLRRLGCPVVMGNADVWLLNPTPSGGDDETTRRWLAIDTWCLAQLSEEDLAFVRTFQSTVACALGDGPTVLCFHGSPRSNHDELRATTPEAELANLLGNTDATVLAGGHTHEQLLRRVGRSLLLNPGSIGLPFERRIVGPNEAGRTPPWSEYAVIAAEEGRLEVSFRRVPLDVDAVIAAALHSGMPEAEWWADGWRAGARQSLGAARFKEGRQ
jgi:putative phosphoesterase